MKRKILKYIAAGCVLAAACAGQSCQDFLTVRPKYSYPDYLMFKSAEGFQDALVGVYMVTRKGPYRLDSGLTGGIDPALGTGFIELLSCFWPVHDVNGAGGTASYALYTHNYLDDAARKAGDGFYMEQHTPVTNINFILKWIDHEDQNFLSEQVYSVVKAEALAIRALCLFDVIRTYGPPPTEDASGLFGKTYAPYPKTIQTQPFQHETYTRFMEYILDDIDTAERLIEGHDPIAEDGVDPDTGGQGWLGARRSKMNYYAIKALKARIYLWMGGEQNKAIALEAAKTVIESGKFAFDAWTSYGGAELEENETPNDGTKPPAYSMGKTEHIFSLLSGGEYEISPFNPKSVNSYAFANYIPLWTYGADGKAELLGEQEAPHRDHVKNIFPDATYDGTTHRMKSSDLRFQLQMAQGKLPQTGVPIRNQEDDGAFPYEGAATYKHSSYLQKNIGIPVLRLAEMYLIAAECALSLSDAEGYLNTLRKARWRPNTSGYEVSLSTEDQRMEWIIGEYVREFYQEGQIFFTYKRLNLKRIPYASAQYSDAFYGGDVHMTTESYIVPLPDTEYSGQPTESTQK